MKVFANVLGALIILYGCTANNPPVNRLSTNFNQGWQFQLAKAPADHPENSKEAWKDIDIPHDWSMEQGFADTARTGGRGGYFSGGIGWYKKTFQIPADYKDKNAVIEFDGVYKDADIWINDAYVGHHQHGYLSFSFDVSQYLKTDSSNTILVKVDNSDWPHDRWYSGAGIYRNVRLTYLSDVHIPTWGTFITTSQQSAENARVSIDLAINNVSDKKQSVYVITDLVDASGTVVASQQSATVAVDDSTTLHQEIVLDSPHLWSLEEPYRYEALHKVYADGKETDQYATPFGIREIAYSKDGFYLNDKKVFLKGVNIHHDAGPEGSAVSDWTIYRRLKTLKEMGCNAIRLSHNAHSPVLMNMCDTMGILLVAEAFDKWEVNTYTTPDGKWTVPLPAFDFKEHWAAYTTDFVKRDRNHPSVIMWSLGNEVVEAADSLGTAVMKRLKKLVNQLDPTRPVTAAIQPPGRTADLRPWDIAFAMDVVSYNYQSQFYQHDKEQYGFIILGSETLPYYTRDNLTEMKQGREAYLPKNSYAEAQKYAIGHMIWAGIDYFGEAVQPWPQKGWENAPINTAGFKKPFFYFLQSRYRDLPMVYSAVRDVNAKKSVGKHGWDWPVVESHWNWTGAKNPLKVLVYSNCEEVALYLNNKLLGSTSEKDADQGYFEFRVPFEKGELKAIGNNNGNAVAEHILNTAGNPYALRLSTDRALLTGTIPAVSHVIAEVVDSAGVIVPKKNFTVRFDVQGAAKIVGVDNGDLGSIESYTGSQRETRDGKCLLVIKSTGKGEIKVSATAAGLESGELILKSKPF